MTEARLANGRVEFSSLMGYELGLIFHNVMAGIGMRDEFRVRDDSRESLAGRLLDEAVAKAPHDEKRRTQIAKNFRHATVREK